VINYSIPQPGQEEQQLIGDHLDAITNVVDRLISIAERGIDLLQERRTALISAAVTGKIDVRGLPNEDVA
jgi:type I restriction enzyme, S subunit